MATSGNMSTSNQYIVYSITVTQNSQSIANNTSNVTVSVRFWRTNTGYTTYGNGTVYCKINGTTYSADVTSDHKITNSGIVLFTKTIDIGHNSDGSKTLSCSAWISHSRFSSNEQSYSQVLTTIPRKSTLAASNGTLNTSQTLTVTKQSSGFTHTITYKCGGASGTVCSKSSSTSISWTPPLSLAAQNTTGTSVTIVFTIETFNGSNSLGTNTKTITCSIPSSVVPSVSFTVSDSTGYASTYGGYVQNKSKASVSISASGNQGSTIKSYSATIDGSSYNSSSFTTGVLKNTGTLTVSVKVTDSRGRTASASKTITVLAYSSPKISSFSAYRCDSAGAATSNGAYLCINFTAAITSLSSKNTASYVLKYKKASDSSYTSVTLSGYAGKYSVSGGSYVFAATTSSSYDLSLTATDAFSSTTKSASGSSVSKTFSILGKGLGFAFGKVAELVDYLDVAWNIRGRGNLTVDGTIYEQGTSLSNKYAAKSHNQPISEGGTGATTAVGATTNLGAMRSTYKNGYAGLTTAGGSDTDWIRTTSAGLLPYKSGGNSSELGTSGWPFKNAWTQSTIARSFHRYASDYSSWVEILASKPLWSGSLAKGGSITVSNFNNYMFFIAFLYYWQVPLVGIRANNTVAFFSQCDKDTTSWAYKATFTTSNNGQTWTLSGASRHKLPGSDPTSHQGEVLSVEAIYGIF